MTLFYDTDEDAVIENHPDFAEFDEDGRLVVDLGDTHDDKRKALLNAAASAVEASDEYDLVTEPETEWTGHGGDN